MFPNIRLCSVIADLPQYTDSCVVKIRNKLFFKPFEFYIRQFDSYVLLTKYMKDIVGCRDDNSIISEGVYDETTTPRQMQCTYRGPFVILYTGMLNKQFGVLNLVNAVHQISDENIELHLYGYGDALSDIEEMSRIDTRIKYRGVISRDKALVEQTKASLLVNPRIPDNNPFTKYSFPSKTLEYFTSGTPTLLYKLDGIPEEYYNYCYAIGPENTDVKYLSRMIEEIKRKTPEENRRYGMRARQFVLDNKNSSVMAKRVVDLLKQTL
jgi:glycosyltransferase involved in cell wall biosynthesis